MILTLSRNICHVAQLWCRCLILVCVCCVVVMYRKGGCCDPESTPIVDPVPLRYSHLSFGYFHVTIVFAIDIEVGFRRMNLHPGETEILLFSRFEYCPFLPWCLWFSVVLSFSVFLVFSVFVWTAQIFGHELSSGSYPFHWIKYSVIPFRVRWFRTLLTSISISRALPSCSHRYGHRA